MRILIVEDEEFIAKALTTVLCNQHYAVEVASDGQAAWDLVQVFDYDLIMLDVMLPKLDGISLCRQIRAQGMKMPILLLTSKDNSHDKAIGLDAGADDYVVKPFDSEELVARVRALLRRGNSTSQPVLEWGGLRLDPSSVQVHYETQLVQLTPKEYALLELFLRNPRRMFSCGAIIDHVWSFDHTPGEEAVRTQIKGLRQKLKAAGAAPDLIETVYGIGYRLKPPQPTTLVTTSPETAENAHQQTLVALAGVWNRFQEKISQQVSVLEQAAAEVLQDTLRPDLRAQAEQHAHTLAGSLGTFGLSKGSQIARKIQHLFEAKKPITLKDGKHLQKLVESLRKEIERSQAGQVSATQTHPDERPRLLIVDSDRQLGHELLIKAELQGIRAKLVTTLSEARENIYHDHPHVMLLDPAVENTTEEGMALLGEVLQQMPPVSVVVFTAHSSLGDRVEVARLGGRAFLQKPLPTNEVLQAVTYLLHPSDTKAEAVVMVVDDDPQLLDTLRTLIEPWGLKVIALDDPRRFWETLEACSPDLLILDIKMPYLSGVELCQVVRNDSRWSALPILFLTAHTDHTTVNQVFAVGADDFISKPIVGPELVTRIINRLERVKLLRRLTKNDPLKTAFNHQATSEQSQDKSKEQLRLALEAAHMGTWDWNLLTNEIVWSRSHEQLFGVTSGTFGGTYEAFNACVHLDDRESVVQAITLAREKRQDYHHEFRVIWPDGSIHWIEAKGQFFYDETGSAVRMIGVVIDVSNHKQAQRSLKARLNQQAAVAKLGQLALEGCELSSLMEEAVTLVTQGLEIEYCKILELIDDGDTALLRAGVGWQEGLVGHLKVITGIHSQAGNALLLNEPIIVEDLRTETKFSSQLLHDHKVISGLTVIIPGQNRPYGVLGAHTTKKRTFTQDDINFLQAVANVLADAIERQQVEQVLQASLKELADLKLALDESCIVAITDDQGRITYVNDKFCEISKYSRAELLGQNHRIINSGYHPNEFFQQMWVTIAKGQIWQGEIKNRAKDGTCYWVYTTVVPLLDKQGKPYQYVAIRSDITERKRAEQALQQSEERFRLLLEGVKDYAIFMLNLDGCIVSWNNAAERINGYRSDEILGQHFSQFYTVEDIKQGKPAQELNVAIIEGRFEDEGWRVRKDGSRFWANVIVTALRDDSGQLYGFSHVTRNITERKKAEEALRKAKDELEMRVAERTAELISVNAQLQSELDERRRTQEALRLSQARFAGILEIADDAIISINIDQNITLFNQGAEKIFGYTASELIGQPLDLLLPRRHSDVHRQHVIEFAQSSGQARKMGEWREIFARRKDGTEFPAEASISKLELGGERIFTVILRDVTETKQAQEALERLSRHNEMILNSMGEGLCGLDKSGKITFVNAAAAKLLGYQATELIREHVNIILPDSKSDGTPYCLTDSPIYESLWDASAHRVNNEVFWRKDRSTVPVEYVSTPIQEQGRTIGAVITFKDITDRQLVERMKDEFISVVSHELRTPLTSIHGSLGMLASGLLDPKSTRGKRLLEIAVDSTDRLVRLINDILDIERIESGKVVMAKQVCNTADLMTKAADVMQAMAQRYQVTLSVSPISVQLWADPDRLIQTLTNLLSNAIKFSPHGATVWLVAECDGNEIQFEVRDRGRGIPNDKLETIFERFQQVDASDSRNCEGTGLGLAICRSIVQQHSGHIWVESELGKGSTFYVTLPIFEELHLP